MRLLVHGRVQGVGFRFWAKREALRLGLNGWVRNRSDGSVEILAHGPEEALATLQQLCCHGPSAAVVTSVTRSEEEDDVEVGTGFAQRPTM